MEKPVTEQPKSKVACAEANEKPSSEESKTARKVDVEVENGTNTSEMVCVCDDLCCCFVIPVYIDIESDKDDYFYALRSIFKMTQSITIVQKVEKVETASYWATLGCCKIETENEYIVKNAETGKLLLSAKVR